jgi:dTDP-4-amino-4,6-dideoxygalactose transaminase
MKQTQTMKQLSTSNLYEPKISSVLGRIQRALLTNQPSDIIFELKMALQRYHQAKYCVTFSSGFWALVAAVCVKARQEGGEVLLPSLTYRRLADAVYWTGNIPVFVDIDLHNLAISPDAIQKHLSGRTALILAVHPIVNCCDINKLIAISQNYDVPIVFDAVESVHETFSGRRIGSVGVGEVFSLHASKLINGIEGGYVCTSDEEIAARLVHTRNNFNAEINPVHAAFAYESLREIENNVTHNQEIYRRYCYGLAEIDGIEVCRFDETEQTAFKNIVVRLNYEEGWNRESLIPYLHRRGILARPHYFPPLHTKTYRYPVIVKEMDNTNVASDKYVNLPCGQRVELTDVDRICETISGFQR